jgi:DNA-binding PadR family transcriptional regulator
MKLLSRTEEFLLLAVWRLQDEAYAVPIRDHLLAITGKSWAFGALFVSLERLVKKGYLTSFLSDPTPTRGGRSKRIYQLTLRGKQALVDIKQVEQAMWHGLPELVLGPQP